VTAPKPSQAPVRGVPPDVYARWCRVDYPLVTDGAIAEMWSWKSDAEHGFWHSLAAPEPDPLPEMAAVIAERDGFRKRAEAAEAAKREARGELAALGDRLAQAIGAAVKAEQARAEAAEAKIAEAREGTRNFLAEYGDSEIPMFKVARDLANSIRKILGGNEVMP
jgi:hypothetical protein